MGRRFALLQKNTFERQKKGEHPQVFPDWHNLKAV